MEFVWNVNYRRRFELNNGSVIEKTSRIAGNMGKMLIAELEKLGNTFTTAYLLSMEKKYINQLD